MHGQPQMRVIGLPIRDEQGFGLPQRGTALDDMPDERFVAEFEQGFVAPHALALPAGDDSEGVYQVGAAFVFILLLARAGARGEILPAF